MLQLSRYWRETPDFGPHLQFFCPILKFSHPVEKKKETFSGKKPKQPSFSPTKSAKLKWHFLSNTKQFYVSRRFEEQQSAIFQHCRIFRFVIDTRLLMMLFNSRQFKKLVSTTKRKSVKLKNSLENIMYTRRRNAPARLPVFLFRYLFCQSEECCPHRVGSAFNIYFIFNQMPFSSK